MRQAPGEHEGIDLYVSLVGKQGSFLYSDRALQGPRATYRPEPLDTAFPTLPPPQCLDLEWGDL